MLSAFGSIFSNNLNIFAVFSDYISETGFRIRLKAR